VQCEEREGRKVQRLSVILLLLLHLPQMLILSASHLMALSGSSSGEVKLLQCRADLSPPFSSEVQNVIDPSCTVPYLLTSQYQSTGTV
jgi:hypothetical protein